MQWIVLSHRLNSNCGRHYVNDEINGDDVKDAGIDDVGIDQVVCESPYTVIAGYFFLNISWKVEHYT